MIRTRNPGDLTREERAVDGRGAMIGLLVVCHCDLGRELLSAAELIVGRLEAADAISITPSTESEVVLRNDR